MINRLFVLNYWLLTAVVLVTPAYAQGQRDDLRRGVAVLREATPLYEKPGERSAISRETLEVGKRYFVLGLSLDGLWAQLLTRRNAKGWVRTQRIYRLPNSDPQLHADFLKLVDRSAWDTSVLTLNFGAYPTMDAIGEAAVSILPRGISGLKGESLDLVVGAVVVKATPNLLRHTAYRALVQWPFRMLVEGNLHIGPRLGFEMRKRFNPVGIETSQSAGFAVMGVLFRYMANPYVGISIIPEFLIHSQEARFHAFAAATLMF